MMYLKLVEAVLVIVCLIVADRVCKGKTYEKAVFITISVLYFAGLVFLTLFRGERAGTSGVIAKFQLPFLDAVPKRHYGLTANRSVLNMLLFVPFGYLLPKLFSLWRHTKPIRWWMVTAAGLLLSLMIESFQLLFHRGVFELDDLIKNTIGAAIGYAIFKALDRREKTHADE